LGGPQNPKKSSKKIFPHGRGPKSFEDFLRFSGPEVLRIRGAVLPDTFVPDKFLEFFYDFFLCLRSAHTKVPGSVGAVAAFSRFEFSCKLQNLCLYVCVARDRLCLGVCDDCGFAREQCRYEGGCRRQGLFASETASKVRFCAVHRNASMVDVHRFRRPLRFS